MHVTLIDNENRMTCPSWWWVGQAMVAPWEGRRMNRPEEDDDVALHLPAVTR